MDYEEKKKLYFNGSDRRISLTTGTEVEVFDTGLLKQIEFEKASSIS